MHEDELWQDLLSNGEPAAQARKRGQPLAKDRICAAAHLWIWRNHESGKQILLQKRAQTKASWPGYYDVSVAGHINFGEKPIAALVREAKEEVNLDLTEDDLFIVGVYRLYARVWQDQKIIDELQWIYLSELNDDEMIHFADGEVDVVEWVNLEDFSTRWSEESFKIVKHDPEYFKLIIDAITRQ